MVARVLGVRSLLADERRFSSLGEQGRNAAAAGHVPLKEVRSEKSDV